jgi:hypothetical protein
MHPIVLHAQQVTHGKNLNFLRWLIVFNIFLNMGILWLLTKS